LNGEANRARQRQKRAIIAAEVKRFAHVINTNGVLGTHTPAGDTIARTLGAVPLIVPVLGKLDGLAALARYFQTP
jgi:hypothetical protein